jgi:hypothetical protein
VLLKGVRRRDRAIFRIFCPNRRDSHEVSSTIHRRLFLYRGSAAVRKEQCIASGGNNGETLLDALFGPGLTMHEHLAGFDHPGLRGYHRGLGKEADFGREGCEKSQGRLGGPG